MTNGAVNEAVARCGIAVEYVDLGCWGDAQLHAEYDPQGPVIRINVRILRALDPKVRDALTAHALAHELYHHFEACGFVACAKRRSDRELAAQRFAKALAGE